MADPANDHDLDAETDMDADMDADAAAMAAVMGFSSFGTQSHANKRRRFHSNADAFVDTPRHGRAQGTSANAVPVGATRSPRPPATAQPISSQSQGHEQGQTQGQASAQPALVHVHALPPRPTPARSLAMNLPPPVLPTNADEIDLLDDDATAETTENASSNFQRQRPGDPDQLDGSILSTIRGSLHRHHHGDPSDPSDGARLTNLHGFRPDLMPSAQGVGPVPSVAGGAQGDPGAYANGHGSAHAPPAQQHYEDGKRDWWDGYYDPSSNENPWQALETRLGLTPRPGAWLARGQYGGEHYEGGQNHHQGPRHYGNHGHQGQGGGYRGRGGGNRGGGRGGRGGFNRGRGGPQRW